MKIREYVIVDSVERAYDLLISDKNNVILGGCSFLKLGCKKVNMAIDLMNLGLDYIKEDDNNIYIGCNTNLRDIETNNIINNYSSKVLSKSISNIVGVSFRNNTKIGASVFAKYGFSDIIPSLLVLDTKVKLYKRGIISLEEFIETKKEKDILIELIIPKIDGVAIFDSIRKSSSDFSILNGAMIKTNDTYKVAIGARPQVGKISYKFSEILNEENDIEKAINAIEEELNFGSNIRASKIYRIDMAKALTKRMYYDLGGNVSDK